MLKAVLVISIIIGMILGRVIYKINEMVLKMKNNAYEKSLNENVVELTQAEYDELCENGWKPNAKIK